jgi:hypothetical protein
MWLSTLRLFVCLFVCVCRQERGNCLAVRYQPGLQHAMPWQRPHRLLWRPPCQQCIPAASQACVITHPRPSACTWSRLDIQRVRMQAHASLLQSFFCLLSSCSCDNTSLRWGSNHMPMHTLCFLARQLATLRTTSVPAPWQHLALLLFVQVLC